MVKKIISSIILIMIICSSCIYATNIVEPEDTTPPSTEDQETIVPDDSTTSGDSENKTPETGDNNDSNIDDSTDSSNDNENSTNNNENNTENNDATNSGNENQTESKEPPKDTTNEPIKNNNQQTTNNNIVQKSSEARLKELKVDIEGLTPEFDKNTTEYYLVVDLSVNKLKVIASTVDNKAKWAVYGNKNLKEGENTVTINVTAEDGTKKEYCIHVTKVDNIEMANAELEKLEIEGFSLYPSFKSNIYSYNLNINKDISNLNITSVPQNEKAIVEIEGNENLHEGENIIKINVTAANKETVRAYKINTYISLDKVEVKEENKTPAIVLIVVLGACIIALGISIVAKNRRK